MTPVNSSLLNAAYSSPVAGKYVRNEYVSSSQAFQDASYAKISSLGKLLNSLEKLKDSLKGIQADSLKIMTAEVSDESVLTAVAYSSASEGGYDVKVTNTAKPHTLLSKAYSSENSAVGTGVLTVKIAENVGTDIEITESRNTLSRLKNVLDTSGSDITAKLIKDETGGYRLSLTAEDSGESNKINITVSDDDLNNLDSNGLSALAYDSSGSKNMSESVQPRNATFFADSGFFEKTSNKVTDAIAGVAMNILKESKGFPARIEVSEDSNSFIFDKLSSFVSAYNDIVKLTEELRGSSGILRNDSSIGHLRNKLEEIETGTYSGSSLKTLGFKFDSKGIMSLDIGKINNAMLSDISGITASINSLSEELGTTADDYIDSVLPNQQADYRSLVSAYIKAEKQAFKKNT